MKILKADFTLSDLSGGGLLVNEQADTFIRTLINTPTIINEVRTVPMNNPSMEVNKILFGSRILQKATQAGGQADNAINARHLLVANRSTPSTSKITLTTSETMAEVRLPYEVLEDNIEREGFSQTVLALIGDRAALDLEELLISADTALSGSDPYLGMQDGLLKRVTTHVVNANGQAVSPTLFNTVKKAMPTQYRRNLSIMRYYASMDVESDYRLAISSRGTGLGDAVLTGTQQVPVFGVPLRGAALMPNANMVLTDPSNILFGIQRNIRIETDKDIRSREYIIVLTARVAIQIEQEDAVVKVVNLGAA